MEQKFTTAESSFSEKEYQPSLLATAEEETDFFVVGIGASAGGLEAITAFFDHLPAFTGASFIIIQHLSPDHKSLMAELLAKHTTLPIVEASEGIPLQANCIYLIPNKNTLTVSQGRLRLLEKERVKAPNLAIDTFFNSLAADKGSKSIGVILSGTGTDGTRGLAAIKASGGLVIVQEPATAHFNGMPNSAIATGLADAVLAPEKMPPHIVQYVGNYLSPDNKKSAQPAENEAVLENILQYVKSAGGLDFTAYKRPTLSRRVTRRMLENHFDSPEAYYEFLQKTPGEIQELCNDFLINVTQFFRDERAFAIIEEKVIPEIIRRKPAADPVKVWVAGCSSGEEAYSVAMLFDIYLTKHQLYYPIKIFATDIDKEVLQVATKGIYPESITRSIPPQLLAQYFIRRNTDYQVGEHLRKMVIFTQHDAAKDAPFSKIDLVCCRNMLIYLNSPLQQKVLNALHFALNIGGFLFLGPSENLGLVKQHFSEISRKWNIYLNLEASRQFLTQNIAGPFISINPLPDGAAKSAKKNIQNNLEAIFNAAIVEEFGYAGVCIDENFRLLHAIGDYKNYLALPDWQLHLSLTKMVPDEIATVLGTSLRKVIKTKQNVALRNLPLLRNQITRSINIVLKPFLSGEYPEPFVFVLFSEASPFLQTQAGSPPSQADADYHTQLAALEQELHETRENLYATFEQLEVSNEELQSNNEELLSANEELQSTNEELQSLNEELHTVNTEHQQKIRELVELNDDLANYFRNTDMGQMFVDQQLIIRKFTPAISNQINIIESDIGRPLAHFSNSLQYDHLLPDIQQVIQTGAPLEKEIAIRDGRYYLMRLMPYLRQNNKPDGAVITFVNITPLKNLNNTLQGILDSSLNGIAALKSVHGADNRIEDFEWTIANQALGKILQKDAYSLTGKKLLVELPGFKKSRLFNRFVQVVATGEPLDVEHHYEEDGIRGWFHVVAVKVEDGLTLTFADITDKKIADQQLLTAYQELQAADENLKQLNNELEAHVTERTRALSLSEERFQLISLATNDAIWDWTLMNNQLWWNEGFKSLFSYTTEQIEPGVESWFTRIHPEDKDRVIGSVNEAINGNASQWSAEYRFRKADGSYAYVFNRAFIVHNEHQIPYRMLGSLIDLTNLKLAQEELRKTNLDLTRINNDLDNFVYTASHDLKSPISNIEGLLYHLELELKDANATVWEILSHIKKSVDRFQTTLKDLTEISKVNKLEEEVTEVTIESLLEDIKVSIHQLIEESGATILIDCTACPHLKFSKRNLRSILYNLVSNAIKYRDFNRPLILKIATIKTPEYTILTVQDNGLGIAEAHRSKLFGMFKRFHSHVDGSGVGLYIVNKIVENAGGKIEVQSKIGEGTTFRIFLRNE